MVNFNSYYNTHLIVYMKSLENPLVESVNLNNGSVKWCFVQDPMKNYPRTSPLGVVGRLICIDSKSGESREERKTKFAIVVSCIKLPSIRTIGNLHGFIGARRSETIHKVIFLYDNHFVDMDLSLIPVTVMR